MSIVSRALGFIRRSVLLAAPLLALISAAPATAEHLRYGWEKVDGINIFYREGGRADAPVILFLHGNPSSSLQYEEVMENLLDTQDVRVVALDYPSFGYSDAPSRESYRYTFENIANTVGRFLEVRGIKRYGLYMQDYGVPVGFRLIASNPDAVSMIAVQNGVIHLDGFPFAQDENGELRSHWTNRNASVDERRERFTASLKYPGPDGWSFSADMSPDAILQMTASAQRPGVIHARNDLWFDYGNNLKNYPAWQAKLRQLNVPVLVMWGHRDDFFTSPGAMAYLRDAPKAEVHIFDGDHFATLEQPDIVSSHLTKFVVRNRDALTRQDRGADKRPAK